MRDSLFYYDLYYKLTPDERSNFYDWWHFFWSCGPGDCSYCHYQNLCDKIYHFRSEEK